MKKLFAVLAVSAFLFACNSGASTESTSTDSTTAVTPAPDSTATTTAPAVDSTVKATVDSAASKVDSAVKK